MSDGGQTIRITRRALMAALKEQPGVVQREFEAARKESAVLDHGPNGFWWWKDRVGDNACALGGQCFVARIEPEALHDSTPLVYWARGASAALDDHAARLDALESKHL